MAPDDIHADLVGARQKCEISLFYFARYVLGYDKLVRRVHEPICQILQNLSRKRVNITMPRNFFKSTIASVAYPLWRTSNDPTVTIQITMNTLDNAKLKLAEIKGHVERNDLFRALYPEVIPDFHHVPWGAESATLERISVDSTPTFTAAGAGTAVISRHVDEILLDDILTAKRDDMTGEDIMPSKRDIAKAVAYFRATISLLKDAKRGRIMNIGTRWAHKDLIAHVLTSSKKFRESNFEVKAVKGNKSVWYENEAVMPELYDIDLLKEIEQHVGSTIFHMWYLNEPVDPSELVFSPDPDKNYYSVADVTDDWIDGLRIYTAVDLAFSDEEKACNNAIATIGVDANNIRYLLDLVYGKMEPLDLIEQLFSIHGRYSPRIIGIEAVAAQIMLGRILPHFMKERDTPLPIRNITRGGKKSKQQRIMLGVQPFVEQGMFKMPRSSVSKPVEAEMADFRLDAKRCGYTDALDAIADAIQLSRAATKENAPEERKKYTQSDIDKATAQCYDMDLALKQMLDASSARHTAFDRQLGGHVFARAL